MLGYYRETEQEEKSELVSDESGVLFLERREGRSPG